MKSVFLLSIDVPHDLKLDLVQRQQLSIIFSHLFEQGHRKMLRVIGIGVVTNLVCLKLHIKGDFQTHKFFSLNLFHFLVILRFTNKHTLQSCQKVSQAKSHLFFLGFIIFSNFKQFSQGKMQHDSVFPQRVRI